MTAQQQQDTHSVVPAQSQGPDSTGRRGRPATAGRYPGAQDDEAYRRSEMEQAKTDIAAGW